MARMMNVPILGLKCPHCGEAIEMFGKSQADQVAAATGIRLLGRLPLDPQLSSLGDSGSVEDYPVELFKGMAKFFSESMAKTH